MINGKGFFIDGDIITIIYCDVNDFHMAFEGYLKPIVYMWTKRAGGFRHAAYR
jgi:hypothetical protein